MAGAPSADQAGRMARLEAECASGGTVSYCSYHSMDYRGRSCPRCDAEERHDATLEASSDAAWEVQRAVERAADRRANPGDHECPSCKYVTLKRGASRCPLCQGTVTDEDWKAIEAREARARIEAAEAAAQRAAAAAEQQRRVRDARQKAAEQEARERRRTALAWLYFGYVVPTATILMSQQLFVVVKDLQPAGWTMGRLVVTFAPGLNWLPAVLILFASDGSRPYYYGPLVAFLALGVLLFRAASSK